MGFIEVQLVQAADTTPCCFHLDEDEIRNNTQAAFDAILANSSYLGLETKKITYEDDEGDDCTLSPASVSDALEFCIVNGQFKVLKLKVEVAPGATHDAIAAETFSPPVRVPEVPAQPPAWAPVTVTHSRKDMKIVPKEMKDDVAAWCDRDYTYRNVPSEMVGATLYSSHHKPAGGGHFTVFAPADAVIYIFSEAHRDGGFPALGWSTVDSGRFHWFEPKKSKAWGLTTWKKESDGTPIDIPVKECLVGGVAIQLRNPALPEPDVSQADKLVEALRTMTMGVDIRKVLPKLAQKCLCIINETQIPELYALLDPLVSLVEGSLDIAHVKEYLEMTKPIWSLPTETKMELAVRLQSALMAVLDELRTEPSTVQVHMSVICDGCGQGPITGQRFKCDTREDYDLCGICHTRRHDFLKSHETCTEMKSNTHADVVGFSFNQCSSCVVCDACNKPCLSPLDRHKCAVCPDYDLCSSCFSNRETIHEHNSWVNFEAPTPPKGDVFLVPAACVPPGVAPPQPAADTDSTNEESPEHFHFYIGDEELTPRVISRALASLLEHRDESVRAATRQAISAAMRKEDMLKESDSDGSVAPSDLDDNEVTTPPSEHGSDGSASTSEHGTEGIAPSSDGDWEKPVLGDTVSIEGADEQQSASAKVLGAHFSDPAQAVFDLVEARGDANEEFAGLIAKYPNVNQAFRLGHLAICNGEQNASATGKILMTNNGTLAWPEICSLRAVAGPTYDFPELTLGSVPPGDSVEIILDLKFGLGQQGDAALSCWAMVDEQGLPFGPLMLLQVSRV